MEAMRNQREPHASNRDHLSCSAAALALMFVVTYQLGAAIIDVTTIALALTSGIIFVSTEFSIVDSWRRNSRLAAYG
jgi:hypothetical protein